MINDRVFESHRGSAREVQLQGEIFLHLHCKLCRRDFAKPIDAAEWKAVHLGMFQFASLDELTSRRWISEGCPGHPAMAELNDLRRVEMAFPILRHPAVRGKSVPHSA